MRNEVIEGGGTHCSDSTDWAEKGVGNISPRSVVWKKDVEYVAKMEEGVRRPFLLKKPRRCSIFLEIQALWKEQREWAGLRKALRIHVRVLARTKKQQERLNHLVKSWFRNVFKGHFGYRAANISTWVGVRLAIEALMSGGAWFWWVHNNR